MPNESPRTAWLFLIQIMKSKEDAFLHPWDKALAFLACTKVYGTSRPVYIHATEIRTWSDAFKIIEFITEVLLCPFQRLYLLTSFLLVHYQRHYEFKLPQRAICGTRHYLMRTSLQHQGSFACFSSDAIQEQKNKVCTTPEVSRALLAGPKHSCSSLRAARRCLCAWEVKSHRLPPRDEHIT